MLVIRMQRTGRKGHASFRVVVQDSRLTPTSGKVVASLGSYDPHSKAITLNKEKAGFYLEHGAQPSDRVAGLLKSEGVKLPNWVTLPAKKERTVRNAEKRRSTAPAKPVEEVAEPVVEASPEAEAPTEEAPAEATKTEGASVEAPAETEAAAEPVETAPGAETESTEPETAEPEPAGDSEKSAPEADAKA